MRALLALIIFCFFLFFTGASAYAGNPFLSKKKAEEAEKEEAPGAYVPAVSAWLPGFLKPVFTAVNHWQRSVKQHLTAFARDMQENPFGRSFFLFLLLSFVYGVVHAIGPGHGKSVVMSYFLNRPGNFFRGIGMGHLITAVHVASGVSVVLVMALVLSTTRIADFEAAGPKLEAVSYTLVILVGIYLAIHTVFDLKEKRWASAEEGGGEFDIRSMVATAFVTGLVPCPGAALILLFSVILGVMTQGLFAMVFIALGMGLTTSAFALIAIGSRKTVLKLARRNEKVFLFAYAALSFAGAFFIILLGSLMLANVFL